MTITKEELTELTRLINDRLQELEADIVSLQADLALIKMVLNRFDGSEDIKRLRDEYRKLAGKEMGDWIDRRRQS